MCIRRYPRDLQLFSPTSTPGAQVIKMELETRPLRVSREVIKAYELRTGFVGIGEHFAKEGLFEFVEEERCKTA